MILFIFLFFLSGLSYSQEKVFHLMGSYAIIDLPDGKEYIAYQYLRELEEKMSDYLEGSEVSLINTEAGKRWVRVSEETYEVLKKSLDISVLTNGAFDITVGAYTIKAKRFKEMPEDKAREFIDYRKILLKEGVVKLEKEGMAIDLGGIAKGFALQKAWERLSLRRGFMAIGGDMKVWGHSRLLGIYDPTSGKTFM